MEEMTMLDTPTQSTTTLLVYDGLPVAHAYLIDTFGLTSGRWKSPRWASRAR